METLRALIRGDLSPAGNRISLVRNSQNFGYAIDGYNSIWVDSGASALALALLDVRKKVQSVLVPKVIIPGYCCPDLVSAAVYAGVKPLVVDICENDASYDLNDLAEALLDENVIAVIAVNFLGIKERLAEIKALVANKPIKLIEDNAQWFPASKDQHQFLGDYVLFSFGRGKPLSLLGGGVLFAKEPLVVNDVVFEAEVNSKKYNLKICLYNILLNPHFYCYLNRAPFLHLGETRYHRHENIFAAGSYQKELFFNNLMRYEQHKNELGSAYEKLCESLDIQQLISLRTQRAMRLLRYPLLCKSADQRDQILKNLSSQGLGVSPLYQYAITEIPMVSELVEVQGELQNAKQFARRFLTLPMHEHVSHQHTSRIKDTLASII